MADKKKPRIVFTLIIGLIGIYLFYTSIDQYILGGGYNWIEEEGVTINAYVDDIIIQEREFTDEYYEIGIPLLKYRINDSTYEAKVDRWYWSLDPDYTSNNPIYYRGDSMQITVSKLNPAMITREGDGAYDTTSIVGFIIWGGLGGFLIFRFIQRLRRTFRTD